MSDIAFQNASNIARMVRSREISPVEVAQSVLDGIGRIEPTLHAFLSTDPERVLESARACERMLMAGDQIPPLLGVPVAIKDMEATVDFPTSQGSRVFQSVQQDVDAIHVARLRAAGAVVVGKTNTPEFALLGETRNQLGPECRNPWDPARTAGGSSGGSAAAVAAGLVPLATGTDTAGSITIPSSFCGTVGLKATHRRIPVWPNSREWPELYDTGPITRSVEDCWLALSAMAGPDSRDVHSVRARLGELDPWEKSRSAELRIVLAHTLGESPIDPDNRRAANDIAVACTDLGHHVREIEPPCDAPAELLDQIGCVQEFLYRGHLLDTHREMLEASTVTVMEAGRELKASVYAQALEHRDIMRDRFDALFEDHDIILLPAAACAAFPVGAPPERIDGVAVESAWDRFAPLNMIANLTGHPALCIPAARDTDELPLGVLVVGPKGGEQAILGLAADIEKHRPWSFRKPEVCA